MFGCQVKYSTILAFGQDLDNLGPAITSNVFHLKSLVIFQKLHVQIPPTSPRKKNICNAFESRSNVIKYKLICVELIRPSELSMPLARFIDGGVRPVSMAWRRRIPDKIGFDGSSAEVMSCRDNAVVATTLRQDKLWLLGGCCGLQ